MTSWKDYGGRAAATTLGYVGGNIPGAIAGYKAYRAFEKFNQRNEMPYKRKRSSPLKGNSKRRRMMKAYSKVKSQRGAGVMAKKVSTPGLYSAGIARYKAKNVRVRRKRIPAISRKFRRKVLKAVEAPSSKGYFRINYDGGFIQQNQIAAFRQHYWTGLNGVPDGNYYFTVDQFVNAASILWNGAHYNSTTFHQPNFANRFADSWNMKLNIISSSHKFVLTNTALRTLYITVYEVKPKRKESFNYGAQANMWTFNGAIYSSTAVTNGQEIRISNTMWDEALVQDNATNSISLDNGTVYAALPASVRGVSPQQSNAFKLKWTTGTLKRIVLEPGQETTVYVAGPGNTVIDLEKYHSDNVYYNLDPKFSRSILFTAHYDQVRGATSGAGRLLSNTIEAGLAISSEFQCKLACPDRVAEDDTKNVSIWVEQGPTAAAVGAPQKATDEDLEAV